LSSIAIKYILVGRVVFDYIPFPIFTHTTGMTHFLDYYIWWFAEDVTRKAWVKKYPNLRQSDVNKILKYV